MELLITGSTRQLSILGECFPILDIEFFVFELIENSHLTFYSWRWRHKNYILR